MRALAALAVAPPAKPTSAATLCSTVGSMGPVNIQALSRSDPGPEVRGRTTRLLPGAALSKRIAQWLDDSPAVQTAREPSGAGSGIADARATWVSAGSTGGNTFGNT